MPSLSANFNVGSGSVSSLIKSASSAQRAIQAYQDQVAADTYKNSAKTDADFQAYQDYLNGRISTLSQSSSITDATKALGLSQSLMAANASNISSNITRDTINIMNGTATPTDKLNYISSAYDRALSIGDQSLALSLVNKADALSQQIQYQAQVAATARNSLLATGAASQDHVATVIENGLRQLNADTGAAGMSALNAHLADYVKANKAQFTALANGPNVDPAAREAMLKAISSSQPSYQDVVAGATAAMSTAHYLAGVALWPTDPVAAQNYLDKQTALANGQTKIPTLAGDLSVNQINQWQQTPAMFIPHENVNSGQLTFSYNDPGAPKGVSSVSGFKLDETGRVVGAYTGSQTNQPLTSAQANQINTALEKMGGGFTKVKAGQSIDQGISVQMNAVDAKGQKTPAWVKQITGGQQNVVLQAIPTSQGVQFASLDASGKANVYLVATDQSGKHAVYKATGQYSDGNPIFGKQTAQGEYGFNQNQNSLWKAPAAGTTPTSMAAQANLQKNGSFGIQNLKNNVYNWLGLGHSDLNTMMGNSQNAVAQMHAKMQQINPTVAAKLVLPSLKPIAQLTVGTNAPAPAMAPMPQQTGNPQANNVSPTPATFNPQSAGQYQSNVQGIPLKLTSGPSIRL